MPDPRPGNADYIIPMDGLHNLRAVEGYATARGGRMRPGRLYRAGAWERISARDRDWFRANVRTVLDLRHPDEVAGAASARSGEPPDVVVHRSVFRPDVPMAEFIAELNAVRGPGITSGRYLDYLKVGAADRFARCVELLAQEAHYPVLINCTAGKDRTGILVAIVMDLLGVDDECIGEEYDRSNAAIDGLIAYLNAIGRTLEGDLDEIRARMATPADRILGFLDGVRAEYGSVRNMLSREGVADATFDALEARLVA